MEQHPDDNDLHGHDDWNDLPSPLFMAILGGSAVAAIIYLIVEVIW